MHQHHAHSSLHARRIVAADAQRLESNHIAPVGVIPSATLIPTSTPVLEARSASTCAPDDDSGTCQKPTGSNTLPIVLGAVIPIGIAIIVLIYLHRRHTKKLALEDLHDKHKSLDFGMTMNQAAGKGRKAGRPEMIDTEKSSHRGRGMSMDMTMGSPYILPPGLHGSRESFHSLSRSMVDGEDPYRPVTYMSGENNNYPRIRTDNGSIYTSSSHGTDRMNANLLKNARPMSQSFPHRGDSVNSQDTSRSPPKISMPDKVHIPQTLSPTSASPSSLAPPSPSNGLAPPSSSEVPRDSYFDNNAKDMRQSNNYLGSFIDSGKTSPDLPSEPAMALTKESLPAVHTVPEPVAPETNNNRLSRPGFPRIQSQEAVIHDPKTASILSETSDYGDGFKITPPSPRDSSIPEIGITHTNADEYPTPEQSMQPQSSGLGVQVPDPDNRRLSMSLRPLPLDDPADNPEQRANRIRSFYKEYFDDSKPDPVGQYPVQEYYEDYGQEFLSDGTVFDPETGNFVVAAPRAPFAEPITRRAMTPPPRAPPRFQGPRGRASSGSQGHFMPPRGMSAMSARTAPRKILPPPTPLQSLPTPHLLKDDTFLINNPLDFAPPVSYRDRQAGRRPDSPMGVARPYSPTVAPFIPLQSAFDELAPMPSPHALRKSGTFTALDFAPPPRFRDPENASDAGSIRSNRSGISHVQMNAVRSGAYRVSRIPKEAVGTKDDMAMSLRPTWTLGGADPRDLLKKGVQS